MSKRNRKIYAWHAWTGLIAGFFILIFFLTGAVIVFREELNKVIDKELFIVRPEGKRLAYQALYDSISRQTGGSVYLYSYRYIPKQATETIELRIYEPARKRYGLLYANPYNGKVLGKTFDSWYDIMLRIHYQFYLGRIGETLAAVFALALLISVLTGFWVYRKSFWKALFFQVRFNRKNWHTISSSLHRILGAWGLVFHFILALSGFWMVKHALLDMPNHLKSDTEKLEIPPAFQVNLDKLIQEAEKKLGGKINYLNFPRKPQDPLNISIKTPDSNWLFGDYNNAIDFDRQSGKITKIFQEKNLSTFERFEYALYTLHFGQFGGVGIKILYCIFALFGAILPITGFVLWRRRNRLRKRKDINQKELAVIQ
jgi:uncharacterized iron-regulated membrane protein